MINKKAMNIWMLISGVVTFVFLFLLHFFHDRFLLPNYTWGRLTAMVGNPLPMFGQGFLGIMTLLIGLLGVGLLVQGIRS